MAGQEDLLFKGELSPWAPFKGVGPLVRSGLPFCGQQMKSQVL